MLDPKLLDDDIVRIPAIPFIDFSRGSVISDSITSAFAPGYVVRTVISASKKTPH